MLICQVTCRVLRNLSNLIGEVRISQGNLEAVEAVGDVVSGHVFCEHDPDVGEHEGRDVDREFVRTVRFGQLARMKIH